jgi:hypothetical protein
MSSREFIAKVRQFLGRFNGPKSRPPIRTSADAPRAARLEMTRLEDRYVPYVGGVTDTAIANAVWGGTNGEIAFDRTGNVSAALTVNYTVGGSAVPGTDYTALPGVVTFAAGSATADVTVVALKNSTDGSDVSLTVASGSGYTVGTPGSADITVIDVPDTVTAFGGFASTAENAATTVPVLNLSSDVDGDAITVTGVTQGADGRVVLNANGTATYTPNAGFSGNDSFSYTVQNQNGSVDAGTVAVAVVAPVAASTAVWTAQNTATNVAVLSLAAGADGDTLTATGVTQGAHGTVVLGGNGTASYTPATGFTGSDSFTYTVTDAYGTTATGTIAVTVGTSVPVALGTSAVTNPNTPVTVGVLGSAFDPSGVTLSVASVTQGANGSVAANANGTATYTPHSGFSGTDSFTYTVSDGLGNSATGTVTVTVGPTAPIALTAAASTTPNTAVTLTVTDFVSAAPGDTLTVTGVGSAADGTAVLNSNGTVTYTPAAGFTGDDTFTYTVQDGFGFVGTGTVSVSVTSTAPVLAESTTAWTSAGTAINLAVLNLADDVSGNALSVSSYTQGTHGSVVLNANGTVTYTPNSGFSGTDSFTYTASDEQGNSATGTVTVTVGPVAPIVEGTSATTAVGTAVNIAVLSLASDPNGDAISVSSVTQGTHGGVVINANGTVTYTPNAGFSGTDTFTYTVTDPYGNRTAGNATVTVGPTVPVALSADASTATGAAVNVAVQSFVSDPGTLTTTSVTQGAHGGVAINANGTVTYTPAAGFGGTDTFTYTVKDGGGQSATGTVTVLVGGAAPAATNVQQTENALGLMTSELGNPNGVSTGLLSAQNAAVAAGISSVLNSIIPLSNIDATFGTATAQINQYNVAYNQYLQLYATESRLNSLLLLNRSVLDFLLNELKEARQAAQPNAQLISLINSTGLQLQRIQANLLVQWGAVSSQLDATAVELIASYVSIQQLYPPRSQLVRISKPPLPPFRDPFVYAP